MNNVLGTGLLIPNKCQILRHVFLKPFISALGRRPHFQEYQSLNTFQIQKVLLTACQGAPQKSKSSLDSARTKVHPQVLTFITQSISSAPSHVVQANLLKGKTCIFPSHALDTHHSQCLAHHRHSKVIKQNQTNFPFHFVMWDQRQKHAPSHLLSFLCRWQMSGCSLVLDHMIAPLFTHFLLISPPYYQSKVEVSKFS